MSARPLPHREQRLSWYKEFSPHRGDSNSCTKPGGFAVTCPWSPNPWRFAGFPQLSQDHQGTGASRSSGTASCQDGHPGLRLLVLPQHQEGSAGAASGPQHCGEASLAPTLMRYQLHQQTALILMLFHLC